MAVDALCSCVLAARDREISVVEVPLEPARIRSAMAQITVGRETCSRVVRVRGSVVIVQVTVHTVGRQSCIHTARVARRTVEGCVGSHEPVGMVEASGGPVVP